MSIRRVAILYNPRPAGVDHSVPDDAYEEYDSPETIAAITGALRIANLEVECVAADRQFPSTLERAGFDIVFNIAEGSGRRCREAIPAAILEFLGIPYTASDPVTLGVTLDKMLARRVVSPDVPVARAVLFDGSVPADLRFPVIVKPNDEGSSKGIRQNAICRDPADARQRAAALQSSYGCPVLIEEFLPGTEVSVGIRGNNPPEVFGMMEIAPKAAEASDFVYSVDVKRKWRALVDYHVPPRLPELTIARLRWCALKAYELLGCLDIARIDFRLNAKGEPVFLECNPLPGLNPENSDIVLMSREAIPYEEVVLGILRDAAARYRLTLP